MLKFGVRLGRVVNVDYQSNTIDVLLEHGGGIMYGVQVAAPMASSTGGYFELPVLKTVAHNPVTNPTINFGTVAPSGDNKNLYYTENITPDKVDFDDPTTNYAYAVIAKFDEAVGKTNCVCLGFVYPFRNQMLFDPENVDTTNPDLTAVVKQAIKQLKGGMFHRTNSGVYWSVDLNGNTEWFHPGGSFFRIAETPTEEDDGIIHVDLTGGNRKSTYKGNKTNMLFDPTKNVGLDQQANAVRKVYAHLEIVTEKGVVEIDINKTTGNVTILTPQNESDAEQGSNGLTIICGGDAILKSIQGDITVEAMNGDVTVQSATGDVTIESANNINVQTDNAQSQSIVLAPNVDTDFLCLFTKIAAKFNQHTHHCPAGTSTPPSVQLVQSDDATKVTVAG